MKSNRVRTFMRKTFLSLVLVAITISVGYAVSQSDTNLPVSISYAAADERLPEPLSTTGLTPVPVELWDVQEEPEPVPAQEPTKAIQKRFVAETPVRLIIPSIHLDTDIISVGLNSKGEMAVPSGDTSHVGWYKYGPKPGQRGSAVLDAHVFAAFDDLRYLKVGSDVIVQTSSGQRLRFVVRESTVYRLNELTSKMLFGRSGDRWLNLITCAGQPTSDGSTYTHRLVVYSTFAEVL